MIVAVEAVVVKDNKYLIIKRSPMEEHAPDTYSLPGGKVELTEPGLEVLEKNLIREVFEETSVNIDEKSINYLESKFFYTDSNIPVIDVVFSCTCSDTEIRRFDPVEVSEVAWMTYEEIMGKEEPTMPCYVKDTIKSLKGL